MITIDGTVTEILGYPRRFIRKEARSPAASEPTKAATAAGNSVKSTSSSLSVFATAPITAAEAAIETGLLNMMENPKTPQKLASSRRANRRPAGSDSATNSSGFRFRASARIQAVTVATTMIISAYTSRSIPERMSSFARSMPLVIKGNPGMINSMEQI